jgi:hypothetical protein
VAENDEVPEGAGSDDESLAYDAEFEEDLKQFQLRL